MSVSARLRVALGKRSYDIEIGKNLAPLAKAAFAAQAKRGRRLVAVADTAFARKNPAFLKALGLETVLLPSGEKAKTLARIQKLLCALSERRLDRTGAVVAVGGGVAGDMAGFAAATYLRGVDFYQIPTTLLAMVDSSVGGKTGVNLPTGKNLVGAFHQPLGVFADLSLLKTLPRREFAAGMAEAIKCALLGDAKLFAILEKAGRLDHESPELAQVVRRCCALKARIVSRDERETAKTGGRALLNLGHTFGHAIEKVGGYGNYLHGEAVSLGIAAAARLSAKRGLISPEDAARAVALLEKQGLPVRLRKPLPLAELCKTLWTDKKALRGKLRFVLLDKLGKAHIADDVSQAEAAAQFRALGAR